MSCCLGQPNNQWKQNKPDGKHQHLSWCSSKTLFHFSFKCNGQCFLCFSALASVFGKCENVTEQHLSVYLILLRRFLIANKHFFLKKNEPSVNLSRGSSVSQLALWPRPPLRSAPHVGARTAASPRLGLSLSPCDIIELLAAAHLSSSSQ